MPPVRRKPIAFKPLSKHGQVIRRRWEALLDQITAAPLPVTFHVGFESGASVVNDKLDDRAREAFYPAIHMIEQISNETLVVKVLTRTELNELESDVESAFSGTPPPSVPGESIASVESLRDELIELLSRYTKSAKER